MKLVVLGTAGYHPNDQRHTACLMIPEAGVVFDAGTAAYRISDYLTTDTLDIFLTHAHLDHIVGLTFLLDVLNGREMRHVRVFGEEEKLDAVTTHLFSEFLFPVRPPFESVVLSPQIALPDGGQLSYFPLKHPGGSVGYRVDWPDRSLAYVTDTTAAPDSDYIEKIAGVDLLIHECNFGDDQPDQAELTGHSCITPVVQVAAAAQVGRLVLLHINPVQENDDVLDIPSAKKIYPNIEVAVDRMEVDF